MSQVIQTPEQQTYLSKLLGFDYTIKYKPGAHNTVADALLRIVPTEATCFTLTMPHCLFLDQLRHTLLQDPQYVGLVHDIQSRPDSHSDLSVHQDLIIRHGRIWLPFPCPLTESLLEEFHSSPIAGHADIAKTFQRLRQNFDWPSIRADVRRYVSHCVICQQTKYEAKKPAGLLQPIPVSTNVWEDLALDFITGLPCSHGFTVILVVVDRYSKATHFGALPAHYMAYKVAVLFLDTVCKLHGFPRSLISDRDPIFISKFWRELFKLSGTKLRMSTAYHPQTNGQTEVLNKTLEQYLRAYVHRQPAHWFRFLSLAELSYNTATHVGTALSPFEVVYGKAPPTVIQYLWGSSSVEAVDHLLSSRQTMHEALQRRLRKVQETMKASADKHRRDLSFAVGDWVYVRLRPYRQTSMAPAYSKLAKRYYGPFEVCERIGPVAYKLRLPASSRIHPVFHVSLLKLHKGPLPLSSKSLPAASVDNHPLVAPVHLLDWRQDHSSSPPTTQVLVQWEGQAPEDSTWERWDDLRHTHNLEDKVAFGVGSVDTNTEDTESNHKVTDDNNINSRPKRDIVKPTYLRDYV